MDFKVFLDNDPLLSEGVVNKRVKITDGPYKGEAGKMVFSKLIGGDERYYVIELDKTVKGADVVIVYNGDYDFT